MKYLTSDALCAESRRRRHFTAIVLLSLAVVGSTDEVVRGQSTKYDANVRPATAATPQLLPAVDSTASSEVIEFRQQPTQAGDRVTQSLDVRLQMTTKIVQSGQIAHEGETSMVRQQVRTVEVTEAKDGRLRQAIATFSKSRALPAAGKQNDGLAPQSIEGKRYVVTRDGDRLLVEDAEGGIPSMDEYKLVVNSLHSLGKPNPLARILVGRRVAVGQRLLIPREVAVEVLGLTPEMGEVRLFELTLREVLPPSEKHRFSRARFDARIETAADETSQLTIKIAGVVDIEVDTSRTVLANLSGPVSLSAIERSPLGIYQYLGSGGISTAIQSEYAFKSDN